MRIKKKINKTKVTYASKHHHSLNKEKTNEI